MRTILGTTVLVLCLFAACGSNGPGSPDAPKQRSEVSTQAQEAGATMCDEATMGEHYCIINPPSSIGNGTVVARQNPVPYQTCKQ
jgi:predicted small lipoprotein YifL